jgi:hypothetical protein
MSRDGDGGYPSPGLKTGAFRRISVMHFDILRHVVEQLAREHGDGSMLYPGKVSILTPVVLPVTVTVVLP